MDNGNVLVAADLGNTSIDLPPVDEKPKNKKTALIILLLVIFSPIIVIVAYLVISNLSKGISDAIDNLNSKGKYETVAKIQLWDGLPSEDAKYVRNYTNGATIIDHALDGDKLYITYRLNNTCPLGLYLAQISLTEMKTKWARNIASDTKCYDTKSEQSLISLYNGNIITHSDENLSNATIYDKNGDPIDEVTSAEWITTIRNDSFGPQDVYLEDGIHSRADSNIGITKKSLNYAVVSKRSGSVIYEDDEPLYEQSWVKDGYEAEMIDAILGEGGKTSVAYYHICREGFMGYCDGGDSTMRREYDTNGKLVSEQEMTGQIPQYNGVFIFNSNDYSYDYADEKNVIEIIKISWQ